jgi:predicted RNA-binding protein YlqC (UPF0109 family)
MKDLVEYIAKALVEHPDEVVVSEVEDSGRAGRVLQLQVALEDRGKVIGKRGRTAQAIRALMNASGSEDGPYVLNIID